MNNERPDGQSVRDLLEAALAHSLGAPARAPAQVSASAADSPMASATTGSSATTASSPMTGSPVVVGEVLDTHHPHLPGRVLVRWWPSADAERSEWLHHERHLALTRGDRVLVTLPLGWAEWIVTGALGQRPLEAPAVAAAGRGADTAEPGALEGAARLQLEPGQALVVVAHDGQPLLQLHQAPEGLRLELVRDQLEIKARRRLRLSADSIEIAAGPGGVDVRTDGEAVTRARAIRLN